MPIWRRCSKGFDLCNLAVYTRATKNKLGGRMRKPTLAYYLAISAACVVCFFIETNHFLLFSITFSQMLIPPIIMVLLMTNCEERDLTLKRLFQHYAKIMLFIVAGLTISGFVLWYAHPFFQLICAILSIYPAFEVYKVGFAWLRFRSDGFTAILDLAWSEPQGYVMYHHSVDRYLSRTTELLPDKSQAKIFRGLFAIVRAHMFALFNDFAVESYW
jgi:hypothetical protein